MAFSSLVDEMMEWWNDEMKWMTEWMYENFQWNLKLLTVLLGIVLLNFFLVAMLSDTYLAQHEKHAWEEGECTAACEIAISVASILFQHW